MEPSPKPERSARALQPTPVCELPPPPRATCRRLRAGAPSPNMAPTTRIWQVHRVARNGRNAEYLSGEEPALGAALAPEYIVGVQAEGVAAVAKHFILNNQETHRDTVSSNADDRTLWEVYYPPFEAAVRA
eukprot:2297703-Prymnesium_polylepis.1